jgi:hypothetical protein
MLGGAYVWHGCSGCGGTCHRGAFQVFEMWWHLAYYSKPCVKEWLAKHREFRLVPLPAYSPNLNLIERLWKFLRKKALNRWHKTFEEMQGAVAEVLDHLGEYRDELSTLMTERFAIVEVEPAVA